LEGRKFFIVFEGLDGSGKTTLAKMLAKDINALYISTPPPCLVGKDNMIRNIFDQEVDLYTRFLYYLLGVFYTSDLVRNLLKSKSVICDRYIHSTICFHKLMGVKEQIQANNHYLLQPDISFFLYVSDEKERCDRIKNRDKRTKYDMVKENDTFRERYINYFKKEKEFIFIDTINNNEKGIVENIKKELRRNKII
jgi:dTMP kinase